MSSHVVVLDSQLRRATVKTTPNKPLSDVLTEACAKLSLDANNYGLKYARLIYLKSGNMLTMSYRHRSKAIDLSRSIRLAGLSSGAKLELTKLSRSPSAVTVCLQLPDSLSEGLENGRLVDTFPSSTTLWLVLRKFESGTGVKRNLTARSVPHTKEGISGAGRLVHYGPVIQTLNRELSSFTDLQKSLAQLGVNSGNLLLRLSFRSTDIPLEEALDQMEEYLKPAEGSATGGAHAGAERSNESAPENGEGLLPDDTAATYMNPEPTNPNIKASPEANTMTGPAKQDDENTANFLKTQPQNSDSHLRNNGINDPSSLSTTASSASPYINRSSITVFAPPSTSKPRAASISFNEKDYEPTIDHAKRHQSRLKDVGRNKRLPTDAEIAEQEAQQAEKRAAIKSVEIKIRMPDQTQVVDAFSDQETNETLYARVRGWMKYEEPFVLSYNTRKGAQPVPANGPARKLIKDLGMEGRVLVTLSWGDGASPKARSDKVLKGEYQAQAQEIPAPPELQEVELNDSKVKTWEPPKATNDADDRSTKVPKWAQGIFKKK